MGQTEAARRVNYRRGRILDFTKQPGGITGSELAEKFNVSRGTILSDIAALRKLGYPIQISSRRAEGGIMVAVYEMLKIPAGPK